MLQPLLERAIFKAGSLNMIRLGDNTIEYSPEFKLFLTTKLPNPHYAPEVCVMVILLNFVTTEEGLTDALLALLVAKESPEMERKRQELLRQKNQRQMGMSSPGPSTAMPSGGGSVHTPGRYDGTALNMLSPIMSSPIRAPMESMSSMHTQQQLQLWHKRPLARTDPCHRFQPIGSR